MKRSFGIAVLAGLAVAIHRVFGGELPPPRLPDGIPPDAWPLAVPLSFVLNVFAGGPPAEQPGWRGYALPLLRRSTSSLQARLVIGTTWGVWHLPFFLTPEAPAVVGGIPRSVLFAWVYCRPRGLALRPRPRSALARGMSPRYRDRDRATGPLRFRAPPARLS